MSCGPDSVAIQVAVTHRGSVHVDVCPTLTSGAAGLALAEAIASYCAAFPATEAERLAYDQRSGDRS